MGMRGYGREWKGMGGNGGNGRKWEGMGMKKKHSRTSLVCRYSSSETFYVATKLSSLFNSVESNMVKRTWQNIEDRSEDYQIA